MSTEYGSKGLSPSMYPEAVKPQYKYTNSLSNMLQEAVSLDILDVNSVQDIIMASKIEKVKKMHRYKVTPPTQKVDRWQTMYRDASGKRKNIKAPSEEALYQKLIPVYFPSMNIDKLTFYELYLEWLEYKKTVTNSPNTIQRHEQHYRKYFEPSVLHSKRIRQLDELTLEIVCNQLVKDYNLSRKEWGNVKTILTGMYVYAVRKKYLSVNIFANVEIKVKFRQVVKKTSATQTYNTDELKELNLYLDRKYAETHDLVFLAIKLNFLLGLRVGELVALKWTDYVDISHLHIVREEVKDKPNNVYHVVEHTKTHTDRFVTLVPKAIHLLQKIPQKSDYIFVRDGERITSRQIAYALEKYAKDTGKIVKSSHKIRKTFASLLNAHGVPLDCIRELLGHSNLSTTLDYIYNPLTEKETYDLLSKAL